MTQQFICDECGQPIDLMLAHYQLSGSKVQQSADGGLIAVEAAVTLHYHEEHLPVYKIEGVPVEPPAPAGPPPDDTPHVEHYDVEPEAGL